MQGKRIVGGARARTIVIGAARLTAGVVPGLLAHGMVVLDQEGGAAASTAVARSTRADAKEWATWPDERLLDTRICDLDLHIEGTELEERIRQLSHELHERGVGFQPHFWLSD